MHLTGGWYSTHALFMLDLFVFFCLKGGVNLNPPASSMFIGWYNGGKPLPSYIPMIWISQFCVWVGGGGLKKVDLWVFVFYSIPRVTQWRRATALVHTINMNISILCVCSRGGYWRMKLHGCWFYSIPVEDLLTIYSRGCTQFLMNI